MREGIPLRSRPGPRYPHFFKANGIRFQATAVLRRPFRADDVAGNPRSRGRAPRTLLPALKSFKAGFAPGLSCATPIVV